MSDTKLKPCPFCGGQIKLDEDGFYMFCCDECGAGITFAKEQGGYAEDCNREESIEKWNTRKPMERIVDELKEYKSTALEIKETGTFVAMDLAIEIVQKEVEEGC